MVDMIEWECQCQGQWNVDGEVVLVVDVERQAPSLHVDNLRY